MQFAHIKSYVLDRRVNEVVAERGFDMSKIENDQHTVISRLAESVILGRRPQYVREAAAIALHIATCILDRDSAPIETRGQSELLCYDGSIDKSLEILREGLPDAYGLAERLANSVRNHGYRDRDSILRATDECLAYCYEFTGDPLDFNTDVVDNTPREWYRDKWPEHRPGLPVPVKVEINRTLARYKLPIDTKIRADITPSGRVILSYLDEKAGWTGLAELKSATAQLENMPRQRAPFPNPARQVTPPFPGWPAPGVAFQDPRFGPSFQSPQFSGHQFNPTQFPQPFNGQSRVPEEGPNFPFPPHAGQPVPPPWFEGLPVPGPNPFPNRPNDGFNYLAGLGLWMTSDPSGLNGVDPNLYRYVGNNPLGRIDPTGLQATLDPTIPVTPPFSNFPTDPVSPPFPRPAPPVQLCPTQSESKDDCINRWQQTLHGTCDQPRSCQNIIDCNELLRRAALNDLCYRTRLARDTECDTFTPGHDNARQQALDDYNFCMKRIKRFNCQGPIGQPPVPSPPPPWGPPYMA